MRMTDADMNTAPDTVTALPDAPLAMPVQDMSPAPVGAFLRDLIPALLRRRARGGKVAGH